MKASPASSAQTETTADCTGSRLRDTMLCRAMMTWLATSTLSTAFCGRAACPPRPSIVTVKRSVEAMIGPGRIAKVPTAMPGMLCIP